MKLYILFILFLSHLGIAPPPKYADVHADEALPPPPKYEEICS